MAKFKSIALGACILVAASYIGYCVIVESQNLYNKYQYYRVQQELIEQELLEKQAQLAKLKAAEKMKNEQEDYQKMLNEPYYGIKGVALATPWDTFREGTSSLIVTLNDGKCTQIFIQSYIAPKDSIKYRYNRYGRLDYKIKKINR